MRVGLQTWGSAGDIRPFIALAAALRRAGHDVALAATAVDGRDWSGLCQSLGVPFEPVQEPGAVDLSRFLRRAGRGAVSLRAVNVFIEEMLLGHVDAMTSAARRLCETRDVVVGHFAVFPLKAQALRVGRPHVSMTFWPGMILTDQCPPHGFPNLGPFWNRLAWKMTRALVDRLALAHAQKVWRGAGLRPCRYMAPEVWFSDRLNLVAASPSLWPSPGGWDGRHRLCGWLGLPDARDWVMPESLARFLDAGEAPVFMTLGSAAQVAAREAEDLLTAAARRSGARAIVQSLDAGLTGEVAPGVFRLGPAPHGPLFARCAAVVHHGGAGTTHAAARAGRPSIVTGFMAEQMSWAGQLRKAGVLSDAMSFLFATTGRLARAIRHTLADASLRRNAEALAARVRNEDGAATAVKALEELAGARGTRGRPAGFAAP